MRASLGLVEARPPIPRWLALAAVLALVASAVFTTWSVLTDRADFGAAARRQATPQEFTDAGAPSADPRARPGAEGEP
jgi:hypothetical protein